MTGPEGETNAAWADLDAPDVKVIHGQFLSIHEGDDQDGTDWKKCTARRFSTHTDRIPALPPLRQEDPHDGS